MELKTVIINMVDENIELKEKVKLYECALRKIDNHIRAAKDPVGHIIGTLKETLPEYND